MMRLRLDRKPLWKEIKVGKRQPLALVEAGAAAVVEVFRRQS